MSEELEFMRRSFESLQHEMRSMKEDLKDDIDAVEGKLDRVLEETVVQRTELKQLRHKSVEHDKLLFQGNGQKALTVQMAEHRAKLNEIEGDVALCKEHRDREEDPDTVKKEKVKKATAVGTTIALVISAVVQWMKDGNVF